MWTGFVLLGTWSIGGLFVYDNEPSDSVEGREFIGLLSDY
jgi:hypothetical protein